MFGRINFMQSSNIKGYTRLGVSFTIPFPSLALLELTLICLYTGVNQQWHINNKHINAYASKFRCFLEARTHNVCFILIRKYTEIRKLYHEYFNIAKVDEVT